MIVWHNGIFEEDGAVHIAPADRGFTLGDGVFDTMLAVDGNPVWPQEHFARLAYNASILKIEFEMDFEATARELLRRNDAQGRYAVRTMVTRGPGARGLAPPDNARPTVIMTAAPAPLKEGRVEMAVAQNVRRNEHSPLSQIKSLNYGDNLLALMEAQSQGADDAVMLNTAGNVCCATTGNIFIREGETLLTPPLADGVLPGIARQKIIARHHATEESIAPERLLEADAVFLTNSIAGIRMVKRIGHTYFNKGEDRTVENLKDALAA